MQNQQKPNYLAFILIGVLAFFVLRGMGDGGDDDGGSDLDVVERQAKISVVEYAENLADDMEEIASEVKSERITTSVQLKDAVRAKTEESRNSAFKDMGALDNRNIPDKIDDPDKVYNYLQAKARGHRSITK